MRHESFYIDSRDAPSQRVRHCTSGIEHHFTEAAVMIAFAMHLFSKGATRIEIHPDSEHARIHDITATLKSTGFVLEQAVGTTKWGGEYKRGSLELHVSPRSSLGDVSAQLSGKRLVAECKGGIINTRNPGQTSRLRKGLCEAIGQLMSRELNDETHVAVVPDTPTARALASKLLDRAKAASIRIALVSASGEVHLL